MIKRSFFGLAKPRLQYNVVPDAVQDLPTPKKAILFLKASEDGGGAGDLKVGDAVKTGQRLAATSESEDYVISSVTGTVSELSPFMGTFGQKYTAITIDATGQDEWDDDFQRDQGLATARRFLEYGPGGPSFEAFADPEKSIRAIVVNGMDEDLLLTANQYVVQNETDNIKAGVEALKKMTDVEHVYMVVPEGLVQQASATGADVKTLTAVYPHSLPHMVMKDLLGEVVPAGEGAEDSGVVFMHAEAVAAIGEAFTTGKPRVSKIVTVVGKDGRSANVKARIGTPIREVLQAWNVVLDERDRLIMGGPMRGRTTYSEELPIEPDTNGIVVQTDSESAQVTDYPCVNCGECVRICPVKIPVNMLVRFLEAQMYEDARDLYDLDCCIECGLCTYVCISRIPIFQYIRQGKHELSLMETPEAES